MKNAKTFNIYKTYTFSLICVLVYEELSVFFSCLISTH